MATYTPARLSQAALGTSSAALYTVPASTKTIVKTVVLANVTAASATVTLYVIPTPGSVASNSNAATTVLPDVAIPANTTKVISLNTVMNTSDILAAKVSVAAAVTATVSGIEIV